jgi:hypothetical protein
VFLLKRIGVSFGIRPLTTIGYRIDKNERLYDPNTGMQIDSAKTHSGVMEVHFF